MRVIAIHTYPVKGCSALAHDAAAVQPWGLEGDRRWLVVGPEGVAITQREVPGLGQLRAVPGRDHLALTHSKDSYLVPNEAFTIPLTSKIFGAVVPARSAGPDADAWVSKVLGVPAQLVWMDDPTTARPVVPDFGIPGDVVSFADVTPLLLANTASLRRLNDWIAEGDSPDEGPLPMNRFRPNLVIDGAAPFQEDEWVGRTIQIGQLAYRVPQACGRCVVTTTDQATGAKGREPLRTLARHRNVEQQLLFGVHLTPVEPGEVRVGDLLTF
ncbi:MOSC domain-containing protein [Allorhizocola rhizosphaerae]|uniref:MOSC domain-containing protein n=1 Tax=Allorhizocola rhizosphaerae TaxID=1872709 RepID=UPI000E3C28AC|nr:MOSC N-terminal beta barrel domain-containing protein [Allorhizocola rhizosphaerae]